MVATFRQYDEGGTTISEYQDIYRDVDVVFRDLKQWRSREIVIKEKLEGYTQDDTIIFWQAYEIPKGSIIRIDGRETALLEDITTVEGAEIELPGGTYFKLSGAVVYDSASEAEDYCDMSRERLEQTFHFNSETQTFMAGVRLPTSYMEDETRVFPVRIDPTETFTACSSSSSSCPTDVYLYGFTGNSSYETALYAGYDFADGVSPCTGGHANRHIVNKFNVYTLPSNATVTDAKYKLTYYNIGCGEYTGIYSMRAKSISYDWTSETSLQYGQIDNSLTGISGSLSVGGTSSCNSNGDVCSFDIYNSIIY
ncbi:MAG: hypothetical protein ABII02_02145 [Candidatus Magasanikbacteria bacterium]